MLHLSGGDSRTGQPRPALLFGLAGLILAVGTALGGELQGQVARGRLVEAGVNQPVGGAMVSLVDRSGRVLEQALTRSGSGLFEVVAPGAGEYRLRADRIGYATSYSGFFRLAAADTLVVQMDATVEPVLLRGLVAEASRVCRVRPEEGLAVARVWEEARKALDAATWTQDRGMYLYEMLKIRRAFDPRGRTVLSEDRSYAQGYRKAPFVALSADSLASKGFVNLTPEESVYWAPDAEVLLSDIFLDTHCFKIEGGSNDAPGLVALRFEPVLERDVIGIKGTLWLDDTTAELRYLEFEYKSRNLPRALRAANAGGRVDFRALPNGTWVVESWQIRMAVAGRRNVVSSLIREPVLLGIVIQSGEVLRVHGDEGVVLETGSGQRIRGVVLDSTGQSGLPGARVFIGGEGAVATTDADGRFELDRLATAEYQVHFTHPYLEDLAYQPESKKARVRGPGKAPPEIRFVAPPLERVLDDVCGDLDRQDDTVTGADGREYATKGVVTGRVNNVSGVPAERVSVRVLALTDSADSVSSVADPSSKSKQPYVKAVGTDASGVYRACWVPVNTPLKVAVLVLPFDTIRRMDTDELLQAQTLVERTLVVPAGEPYQTLEFSLNEKRDLED